MVDPVIHAEMTILIQREKELEREIEELENDEIPLWKKRVGLAENKGMTDLADEARGRVRELIAKLDAHKRELDSIDMQKSMLRKESRRPSGREVERAEHLLEQVRATLVPARVPKIHAETAVKQNRGVLSILDNMVRPEMDALPENERERLRWAMDTAREAVEAHQTWLENELLPAAAGEFRIGAELFDAKLAFVLHTPLTRAQVRERAEREYRRVRDEIRAFIDDLPGILEELETEEESR